MGTRKTYHPRLSAMELRKVCTDYINGMTIQEVADKYGYSYSGMNTVLHRAGVILRPQGREGLKRQSNEVMEKSLQNVLDYTSKPNG